MEPNKPLHMPEELEEPYTPRQQAVLKILRLGAWISVWVALTYVMHS